MITTGWSDRKKLDTIQPLRLLVPDFEPENNANNDPPYNSRQYSDAYHLLENLASWEKPPVHGKAKKMDRSHIKSDYCLQSASKVFANLNFNYN